MGHTLHLRPSTEHVDGNVADHVQNGILKRERTPGGAVSSQTGANGLRPLGVGTGNPPLAEPIRFFDSLTSGVYPGG